MPTTRHTYLLNKRSARKVNYSVDLHDELEKITQQQVKLFEEQLQNIANDMQKKLLSEFSHKLNEQLMGSITGGGLLQDALGKTLQQSISSLGNII